MEMGQSIALSIAIQEVGLPTSTSASAASEAACSAAAAVESTSRSAALPSAATACCNFGMKPVANEWNGDAYGAATLEIS